MMYRIFTRTWYPGPGPKRYQRGLFSLEEAKEICKRDNDARGPTKRGRNGLATEFEEN